MWALGGTSPFELPHQTSQLLLQPHNTLQRGARAKLHPQHSDPLTGDNYAMTYSFHCHAMLAWHKLHVTTWCSVLRVTCCLWESGQLLTLQQTERDKSPARLTETPPDRSADPTPMSLMTGGGIKSLVEWHHYDKFPDLLHQHYSLQEDLCVLAEPGS